MGDSYKVEWLKKMLEHETSKPARRRSITERDSLTGMVILKC